MLKKNIISLKKYFETKPYEVPVFRFWAIILGLFIPIYGILLEYLNPESIEFLSHRLLLGLGWVSLFIASFKFDSIKKNLIILSYIGNLTTVFWIIWIVQLNDYSPDYNIGLFLVLCMGIVYRDYKEMIVFYLITISVLAVAMSKSSVFAVNPLVFGLSVLILVSVYLILMFQRNHINRNLIRANKALSDKNKELEQFVFISSHDLKTPLRNIESFATLLKRKIETLDKKNIELYTDYIINNSSRMNNILDDLLKYSVIGRSKISFEETNIAALIDTLSNELKLNKDSDNANIIIPKALPTKVICNASQITQVFQNLIENGLKYNTSKQRNIILNYYETKRHWEFLVQDNGIGIDDKYFQRIFNIFQRLHTHDEFKGSGIGLAICKRIVEMHEGTISVESKEGEGTTFQFSIAKKLAHSVDTIHGKKTSILHSFFRGRQSA